MAVWGMDQEKDVCDIFFKEGKRNALSPCFNKANEAVVAEIYQFLGGIETQIRYQQLVL